VNISNDIPIVDSKVINESSHKEDSGLDIKPNK